MAHHSNDDTPKIRAIHQHAKALSPLEAKAPRGADRAIPRKTSQAIARDTASGGSPHASGPKSPRAPEERMRSTTQPSAPRLGNTPSAPPGDATAPPAQDDPHIDAILSELAERAKPPTEDEIEALASRMASHLITCEECQQTLSIIIHRLTEQAGENTAERERGARLLERFNSVLVKARARNRLGAYALMCCTHGTSAANRKYPEVVAHLETCERCRDDVTIRIQQHEERFKAQEHPTDPH